MPLRTRERNGGVRTEIGTHLCLPVPGRRPSCTDLSVCVVVQSPDADGLASVAPEAALDGNPGTVPSRLVLPTGHPIRRD
jgi:hypothetical protein